MLIKKHCDREMTLIKGTWGHWLSKPYWKCLRCGEVLLCTFKEKTDIRTLSQQTTVCYTLSKG